MSSERLFAGFLLSLCFNLLPRGHASVDEKFLCGACGVSGRRVWVCVSGFGRVGVGSGFGVGSVVSGMAGLRCWGLGLAVW